MALSESARALVTLLRRLRAVRQFRSEPLPRDVVDDVLDVARWTGSAVNRQPWEFIVVRDRDVMRRLAGVRGHLSHLSEAAAGIVLVMSGDEFEQETYDEGRLSERIMLAAAAHGVGAGIGWFAGDGRDAAKQLLGIPERRLVRTAISLGFADEAALRARPARPQPRKPLAELVHYDRYGRHEP